MGCSTVSCIAYSIISHFLRVYTVVCILQMDVFDAAERYRKEGRQLIILAGKDYGSGSSRDWAAKGPWMQVRENIDKGIRS